MNLQDNIATTEVELLRHENRLLNTRMGHMRIALQSFVDAHNKGEANRTDYAALCARVSCLLEWVSPASEGESKDAS